MIEVFKKNKGYGNIGSEIFFSKIHLGLIRGHSMKVTRFRLNVGKFSFSNRVVNEWNGLSELSRVNRWQVLRKGLIII